MNKYLAKFYNSTWFGILVGLVFPAILCSLARYLIRHVFYLSNADLLYIAAIAVNAFTMQHFFKQGREHVGRGVLVSTFICAFVFYAYKVGWLYTLPFFN